MHIDINDSTIEDLIREALDGVDIVGQVDVEELVTNEIQELNLLEGIDVKGLVRSAIKDALEDSDDFNTFMMMRSRVEKLELAGEQHELSILQLSTRLDSLAKLIQYHNDEFNTVQEKLLQVEERQRRPLWKFWA